MQANIRLIECANQILFSNDGKTMHLDQLGHIQTRDAVTGELIHEFPHSGTAPRIGGQSPDGSLIYATDFYGRHVIITDTQKQTQTLGYETDWTAIGLAVSADGKLLYIITGEAGKNVIAVVDSATQSLVKKIPIGRLHVAIKLNPVNSFFYILTAVNKTEGIHVLNPQTDKLTLVPIPITIRSDVVFDPLKRLAYISNWEGKSIAVVDTMNDGIRATYSVEGTPHEMALSADGSFLYALNGHGSNLIDVYETATMTLVEQLPLDRNDLRVIATGPTGDIWVGYYIQDPLSKS